jgi:hypothetical protein
VTQIGRGLISLLLPPLLPPPCAWCVVRGAWCVVRGAWCVVRYAWWQVAEHGNNRVQEVDVMAQSHIGYLCRPGTIAGPRAVTASPSLVAVSAWSRGDSGQHVVCLFDAVSRVALRTLGGVCGGEDGQLLCPRGLRVTADGNGVLVADEGKSSVVWVDGPSVVAGGWEVGNGVCSAHT